MKFQNWKDAAELVGIAAIVASLIFVGLQMRQSGAIARSQMYGNDLANSLSTYNAIAEHPDIWVRGKRGDELDPADAELFQRQVLGIADQAYYEALEGGLLGFDSSEIQLDVIDFAGFLYENPGVREVWQSEEQRLRRYRRLVLPGEQRSDWLERVNGILMKIARADADNNRDPR